MTTQTIYLDDLSAHLQLTDAGADASWPSDIEIELDVRWNRAEPDVGIDAYGEISGVTYYLAGESYDKADDFIEALYLVIGEWCEEGPDVIAAMIAARIENEELEQ